MPKLIVIIGFFIVFCLQDVLGTNCDQSTLEGCFQSRPPSNADALQLYCEDNAAARSVACYEAIECDADQNATLYTTYLQFIGEADANVYICNSSEFAQRYVNYGECAFTAREAGIGSCGENTETNICKHFQKVFDCLFYLVKGRCGVDAARMSLEYDLRSSERGFKFFQCSITADDLDFTPTSGHITSSMTSSLMLLSLILLVIR